jgi:hypothetical protein
MNYPLTYVYELYRGDALFYVGKTLNPYNRLIYHFGTFGKDIKMVIIDIYVDLEHKYIYDYLELKKGITNKDIPSNKEKKYEIGEILKSSDNSKPAYKIWDNNLQRGFNSLYECSKHYKISDFRIKRHLFKKDHLLNDILDLELIN